MSIKENFLQEITEKAKQNPSNILLAEADIDDQTLEAGLICAKNKEAFITLLAKPGNNKELHQKVKSQIGTFNNYINIIDPDTFHLSTDFFAQQLHNLRKNKGLDLETAKNLIQSPYYYSPLLLKNKIVDGIVTGHVCTTKESIKPAMQILKKETGKNFASSFFIMLHKTRLLLFADCAINIEPTAEELSQIALDTAKTSQKFGISPKIAFLSFSTNQSSKHPSAQKIVEATKITQKYIQENNLNYIAEGDIQLDAAIIPEIGDKKFPNNSLKGEANILIFPDLFAANISYKMVERLGDAEAIGPIIQGLSAPFNDLSRGANLEDIINIIKITSVDASK